MKSPAKKRYRIGKDNKLKIMAAMVELVEELGNEARAREVLSLDDTTYSQWKADEAYKKQISAALDRHIAKLKAQAIELKQQLMLEGWQYILRAIRGEQVAITNEYEITIDGEKRLIKTKETTVMPPNPFFNELCRSFAEASADKEFVIRVNVASPSVDEDEDEQQTYSDFEDDEPSS